MSAARTSVPSPAAGFTLVEVLIATSLMVTVSLVVAQLFAVATTAGAAARDQTTTTILAGAKLEQLRSLTWSYEPAAPAPVPRSDTTANLSVDPPDDSGTGLMASPPGTLTANTQSFVDYLDVQGRWVGNGTSPAPDTMFVRRWSVRPLPQDPLRTLILTVRVTPIAAEARRGRAAWTARSGQEAVLVGLKTRKGL